MQRLPYMPAPCDNCPMRKDCLSGWLGSGRMQEILESDSFVCHKTTSKGDKSKRQCAGHLHLKKSSNIFYKLAKAIGTTIKITNSSALFDNEQDCIKHHENGKDKKS